MAKLQIRIDGDPILRKKSRKVEVIDEDIHRLIDDMYETMYEAQGVGLAAVQIGKLKQLIVIDDYEGTKIVLINPERVAEEGSSEALEGCLSVPERVGKVKRFEKIKINYTDRDGEEKTLEAEDFLARIIQHEMDHLEGILYTDLTDEMYDVDRSSESEAE
ncbi:peptide deformylase [Aedoeadaptatus acetigenes]|uniref:Peptide deformylase n=1 Tax=Aedoeadaptatus acetigenes TaxID=2981723 RepID=A0ABV1J7I0_9FIRM|nr:peptide deformylase [Aedoeadaptatus acetigenes]MCU6787322.1 peptide deformylase [Aedoeadaptatus acetigenes]